MNKKMGLILCSVAFATGAMAADTTWTGTSDGTTWDDVGNWDAGLPTNALNTVIDETADITLPSGTQLVNKNFTIAASDNRHVTITNNGIFQFKGNTTIAGGMGSSVKLDLDNLLYKNAGKNLEIANGSSNSTGIINIDKDNNTAIQLNGIEMAGGNDTYAAINASGKKFKLDNTLKMATGDRSTAVLDVKQLDTINIASSSGGTVFTTNVMSTIELGSGNSSTATVSYASGVITLADGGDLSVGTGKDSLVTLSDDIVLDGELGNFSVGTGASDSVADLINQANSVGNIVANRDLFITNGTHTINSLMVNADTTIDGDTAAITLKDKIRITVGGIDDLTGTLNLDGVSDVSVGNLRVGWNDGSSGTLNAGDANLTLSFNGSIANGVSSTGTVNAASITLNDATRNLGFGTKLNSHATANLTDLTLVAGVFNIANSAGTGSADINVSDTFTVGLDGEVNIYGGTVDAGNVSITGTVNLVDGVLTAGTLTMDPTTSSLVLGAGELVVAGDALTQLSDLYNDGFISMDIGNGTLTNTFTTSGFDSFFEVAGGGGTNRVFLASAGGNTTMWAETIPEPATIGMMMLVGGGLLFIRRRRMN